MFKFLLIWTLINFLDSTKCSVQLLSSPKELNDDFYNEIRQLIKRKMNENPIATENDEKTNSLNIPTPKLVENWPETPVKFGQISAVAVDPSGRPVIFHRSNRIWDYNTFNESQHFQLIDNGPIAEKTLYVLNPSNGQIEHGWGENMFYLPHGLTIDIHGYYWITDVAMHQVFKFKSKNPNPIIELGERFQPGTSLSHFCKPTAVAVATTGEFFVADGYCNQRVLKYNAAGRLLRQFPQPPEFMSLDVPHGITLLEHLDLLCIADRENMRVVCPKAGLKSSKSEGQPAATIQEPDLGRVFDVAAYGDIVYAVNGPTSSILPVRGFTIDPRSETIIDHWGEFTNPHSIAVCSSAVCPNGTVLYVSEIGPNKIWKFLLT